MDYRIIAINLPQFHPFKENDEWWGKGFTEWTNVTKALPRFKGHYQPHLPTETGFYDLRLPEAREMQADMAKKYGIYGFCYYHYWFNGHRLMNRPLDDIIHTGKPDFPFMLCWANENWTRNWAGGYKDILIEQKYSEDDDKKHIRFLCENFFNDARYITVNNKPVFVIYKPQDFPNIKHTINIWRDIAKEYKIELYLAFMMRRDIDCQHYLKCGFDSVIDFQPMSYINEYQKLHNNHINSLLFKFFKKEYNLIFDYNNYVDFCIKKPFPNFKFYPGITPGWDNSCRRIGQHFMAFKNANPYKFEEWLKSIIEKFNPYSPNENFIFINAWNEWAEGNHMEPDIKWGNKFLQATKNVISHIDD